MAKQLIVTLLVVGSLWLPLCLANGKTEQRLHSAPQRFRQRQALPLRDDADYLHETDATAGLIVDDITPDYVVLPQTLRKAKSKRRDYAMKMKMDASGESVVMPTVDSVVPVTIDACPGECTCLNDFMSCSQLQQSDELPTIPQHISSLELFHSHLDADMCERNIRDVANLMALRVNNNRLARMPVFNGLRSLEKLELMNNEIRAISIAAVRALPKLSYLDLSGNRIMSVETSPFPKVNALQKLILNDNHIEKLDRRSFETLVHLHELKMNGNRIGHLPTGIFTKLKKVKKLDLSNNQLTELNRDGLLNLTSLTWLDASNNSIHTIGKDCWEFTQRIVHLDLSGNEIKEITFGTFHTLWKLKYLNLRANMISTIRSNAMNATPNLELLDLSRNMISWAVEDSMGPFSALSRLNALDLSGNHIKAITNNSFIGLFNLTKLDIRRNNITTIQSEAFDGPSTPALHHILIDSVDLICDCHLIWFYQRFKAMAATSSHAESSKTHRISVSCAYPAMVRNKPLLLLDENDFTCDTIPKPQMIDAPKSPLIAIRGENITIECSAFLTAGSHIEFIWKHDNVEIGQESIETTTRLKSDYRVRVKEKLVDVRRPMGQVAQTLPLSASSNDDDDTSYGDDYDRDDRKTDYADYDTEKVDATAEDIEANVPINSTIATSRLTIADVHDRHAGRYQCIASNAFGKAYSQKFKMSVASFPVFTKRPTNVTARTSETIRLMCAVEADPKAQVYWQFNFGNDFPAARERRMHMIGDDTIVIRAAKASDGGVYTCTAENPAGIISINVTVDIIEPLVYIRPIETKDTTTGDCAVLECANSESALTGIRWYKNSKPISADDKRYILAQGNRLLIIAKTTDEDDGLYTCEMENSLGKEKLMIKLSIHPKVVRIDEPDKIDRHQCIITNFVSSAYWIVGTSVLWAYFLYARRRCCKRSHPSDLSHPSNGRSAATQAHSTAACAGNKAKSLTNGLFFDRGNASARPTNMFPDNALNMHSDSINNDHEALLGSKCFDHQPHLMRPNNFLAKIRGIDKVYRPHGGDSMENASTATCADEPYSSKTKMSSLSSSCNSIPALSFNSSHELDSQRMRNYESLPKNFSNGIGNAVASERPKPNIHTNELNELMATLEP